MNLSTERNFRLEKKTFNLRAGKYPFYQKRFLDFISLRHFFSNECGLQFAYQGRVQWMGEGIAHCIQRARDFGHIRETERVWGYIQGEEKGGGSS